MTATTKEGIFNALNSLFFLALPPSKKIMSWELARARFSVPSFFLRDSDTGGAPDYFFGTALVFVSYAMFLRDGYALEFPENAAENFSHRLNAMMGFRDASDWGEQAVLRSEKWALLTADARSLVDALDVRFGDEAPVLDVKSLINSSDFAETEELKRLLD